MNERKELEGKIKRLKRERDAVILAHNYQLPEVQEVADFLGDSLDLSRRAKDTSARVIVFCGVHFMAETAALLSPEKTVLLPNLNAGCPMADMITKKDLLKMREENPDAVVVCYVNSSAEVKAISDVCCTSANAADIVSRVPLDRRVIFVPDRYLGAHVEKKTGRKLICWPGFCPTHARLEPEHIEWARQEHPDAKVMVHPECALEVSALADEVLSTGGMVGFAQKTSAKTVVVGTEVGLLSRLRRENPDKEFVPLYAFAVCPNMKLTSLKSVAAALEEMKHRVEVPAQVRDKARNAILRMLDDGPIEPSEWSNEN